MLSVHLYIVIIVRVLSFLSVLTAGTAIQFWELRVDLIIANTEATQRQL